jgi:cytidylate kinase
MDGVVLVTGVMAAGKSTVAQALAERLPRAAHVRGDVFRRMIVSGRVEYDPGAEDDAGGEGVDGGEGEAQLRLRYRLSAAAADAYAEAGFTAVVQDVVPELRARTPRIGLWVDSSELSVGETVEAILAGRERARVG